MFRIFAMSDVPPSDASPLSRGIPARGGSTPTSDLPPQSSSTQPTLSHLAPRPGNEDTTADGNTNFKSMRGVIEDLVKTVEVMQTKMEEMRDTQQLHLAREYANVELPKRGRSTSPTGRSVSFSPSLSSSSSAPSSSSSNSPTGGRSPNPRGPVSMPILEHSLTRYNQPGGVWDDLSRLLKATALTQEKFSPSTEKEYDDILDDWEERLDTVGADRRYLICLLSRLGTPRIKAWMRNMTPTTKTLGWATIRNRLAIDLFKFSSQFKLLRDSMRRPNRQTTVLAASNEVQKLCDRFELFSERWEKEHTLLDEERIDCLLLRLPKPVVNALLSSEWRPQQTYEELLARCESFECSAENKRMFGGDTTDDVHVGTITHSAATSFDDTDDDSLDIKIGNAIHGRKLCA